MGVEQLTGFDVALAIDVTGLAVWTPMQNRRPSNHGLGAVVHYAATAKNSVRPTESLSSRLCQAAARKSFARVELGLDPAILVGPRLMASARTVDMRNVRVLVCSPL